MEHDQPDEQFTPETIDERVEMLLQLPKQHALRTPPDARLTRDLALIHQENLQILERAWQRLAIHPVVSQKSVHIAPLAAERLQPMQQIQSIQKKQPIQKNIKHSVQRSGWQRLSLLVASLLVLLVVGSAVAVFAYIQQSKGPLSPVGQTPIVRATSTTSPSPTSGPSQQMPATLTSCPATGTARALVTRPLVSGNHPTVVYRVNLPGAGSLKRYDVTTRQTTEILSLPGATIDKAQISADGKWVLFTSGPKLQVVRIDGQGLQTLYCDAKSSNYQWSTNQNLIAFESADGSIKVLHVAKGTIDTVLGRQLDLVRSYDLRSWLDNSHLYLTKKVTDAPPDTLAVLDLQQGLDQSTGNLTIVEKSGQVAFQDFDSSYDGTKVFVAHSPCAYGCSGPGDIVVKPALGGAGQTIYSSKAYSVVQVRAVTRDSLIFSVNNVGFPNNNNSDQSHNGLWLIHTDGTGLIRLTTDKNLLFTNLNGDSQFPWSNVSRDGSIYAIVQQNGQTPAGALTLLIGSLNGGAPAPITNSLGSAPLSLVGWTTS